MIDDIRQLLARASAPVRSAPEPESGAFDSAFSDALGQRTRTDAGNRGPADPADARVGNARAADARVTEARLASERMARARDRSSAPAGQRLSQQTTGSAPTGRADGPGRARDIDDRRTEAAANATSALTAALAPALTPAPANPPASDTTADTTAAATRRPESVDGTNGSVASPGSTTDGLTRETAAAGQPSAGPMTPPNDALWLRTVLRR